MPNWLIEVGVAGGRDTAHRTLEIKNDATEVDASVCPSPTGLVGISECGPMYQYEANWGYQVSSVDCRVPGTL